MAILYCSWNNTAVAASSNVISQRVSWREKTLGGAFNTTSITPSNDMAKTINAADFTAATVNKVYEFKVEAICTTGGPTINSNGIVESIVFQCVTPETIVATSTTLNFHVNIPSTDITKARLRLRLQSDNSLIATQTVTKSANAIDYTFTGLTNNTGYYVEVEYYAVVNTIEVISSSVDYLGNPCGGNITGYTATTGSNIRVSNSSLDIVFGPLIQLDGVNVTGSFPTSGSPDTNHNLANDGTVDVYIEWNGSAISGQHILVTDTNGVVAGCISVDNGDPTPFDTILGVDMTGSSPLLIEALDGVCP